MIDGIALGADSLQFGVELPGSGDTFRRVRLQNRLHLSDTRFLRPGKKDLSCRNTCRRCPTPDAGVGAQYVGKRRFYAGNEVVVRGGHSADVDMPSFWVFNATMGYKVNKNLNLRLNVNNLFNEFYLQQGSSSSDGFQLFGVPGAGRTVILNAQATF